MTEAEREEVVERTMTELERRCAPEKATQEEYLDVLKSLVEECQLRISTVEKEMEG